jgi:hypothetical protein
MFMVLQAGVGARWFPIATQPIILLCYAKMINNSNGSALQQWLKVCVAAIMMIYHAHILILIL